MKEFYAHSANDKGQWHLLVEHLRAVAETAGKFCEPVATKEVAYYAGLWHDLGKFNPEFQRYLSGDRPRGPDHKGAGAKLAFSNMEPLSLLVQGHHGGLQAMKGFKGWIEEKGSNPATEAALATARRYIANLVPQTQLRPPAWVKGSRLSAELWLRMVFSALVDADFLDTERHFNPDREARRASGTSLGNLWETFRHWHLEQVQGKATKTMVNGIRAEIYHDCIAAAERRPGIFRLAVPTGGGKTLSAMGFALRHASIHRLDRVIVAVPFISITQQTAGECRRFLEEQNDGPEVVLEHQSSVEMDDSNDYVPEERWSRLASENWDAPVIVTTTVQLFNSLFSNRTSSTRKLHNLVRSVIILDEAQALPPNLLAPILDVLQELVNHYGASVVLSTATQPAFQAIETFGNVDAVDIVPSPERHFQALKRVRYEWRTDSKLSWEDIAARMQEETQSLAIVNTKKDALVLLEALDDERALHLSKLLCGRHRQDVIREIKRRLGKGEDCRVVSTQVVEAGVDLDFPMVLRAIGPLDSIIQAAGRCNRNGLLAEGRVVVFDPAEASTPPFGSYRIGTAETKTMLNAGPVDMDDPQVMAQYFRRLYRDVDTDGRKVQASRSQFDYPEVARKFRMIDDDTVTAIVAAYGPPEERKRVRDAVAALRSGTPDARRLIRAVQPWTVSLYRNQTAEKERAGLLAEITPGLYEWSGSYNDVTGIGGVTGVDPDRLVI